MKVIYIKGEKVCVTDEVYMVFEKSERKERYRNDDLKNDKFLINPQNGSVKRILSREDSFDRLTDDCNLEFADESMNTEDEVIMAMLIETLREAVMTLTDTEKHIIYGLFFQGKTAKRISKELGVTVQAIYQRKHNILKKLRKILEKQKNFLK